MSNKSTQEYIDFVKKTTEVITIMAEGNKVISENTGAIKELINTQNVNNAKQFEIIIGKQDGLLTMFKYVIIPLIAGILALVGVKMAFNL